MKKKINSPQSNIESRISVKPEDIAEADRIENDPEAMLRLIDVLFFLKEESGPPS